MPRRPTEYEANSSCDNRIPREWLRDGRVDDARNLLSPVYDWFTEGFDTADLLDAKSLLQQM